MDKVPITVVVMAYNEEENISDCLASAKFADELLVIDSGSQDKTDEIALKFGAKILQRPLNNDYGAQRNFAIANAKHEWIMMLDADERITESLADEIKQIVTENKHVCALISRENHFKEGKVLHGVLRPDLVERVFKKDEAHYEGCVHERLKTSAKKIRLSGKLIHFPYKSWETHLEKMNCYTSLLAKKYYEQGKNSSFISGIILKPVWGFIKMYVVHLGFLDGKLGFEFCLLHAFYTLEKYLKLRSLHEYNGRI